MSRLSAASRSPAALATLLCEAQAENLRLCLTLRAAWSYVRDLEARLGVPPRALPEADSGYLREQEREVG